MLRKYHPLYLNTHFEHPRELTPQAVKALTRLADAGIPLGNQSVLLKGVNDDPALFLELNRRLLACRVRPYYIYQADLVEGTEHFRTPVETGLEVIRGLRGHTSGLAVPQFVIDAPGGGGKIPLLPEYTAQRDPSRLVLRNYQGDLYVYPEVQHPGTYCPQEALYGRPLRKSEMG
jgi:lysine 2,3-aminomutase